MNPDQQYDIDKLLSQKPFDALSAEERAFALSICETQARYDALRDTVLRVKTDMEGSRSAMPKSAKRDIMAAFDKKHKQETKVVAMWNGHKAWYQQPVMRLVAAVAVIGVLLWALPVFDLEKTQIAENKIEKPEQKVVPAKSDSAPVPALQEAAIEDAEITGNSAPAESEEMLSPTPARDNSRMAESEGAKPADVPTKSAELVKEEPLEISDKPFLANAEIEASQSDAAMNGARDAPATLDSANQLDEVAVWQHFSLSRASTQAEVIVESRTSREKKKAFTESAFSFKLSNRPNWKQSHYTAW